MCACSLIRLVRYGLRGKRASPLSPELIKTHTHAKYIENIVFEPSKRHSINIQLNPHTITANETDYNYKKTVQSERCRKARKNPRMRGNLGWGQGTISSFPNERIEHKTTKQTIQIPRDCV